LVVYLGRLKHFTRGYYGFLRQRVEWMIEAIDATEAMVAAGICLDANSNKASEHLSGLQRLTWELDTFATSRELSLTVIDHSRIDADGPIKHTIGVIQYILSLQQDNDPVILHLMLNYINWRNEHDRLSYALRGGMSTMVGRMDQAYRKYHPKVEFVQPYSSKERSKLREAMIRSTNGCKFLTYVLEAKSRKQIKCIDHANRIILGFLSEVDIEHLIRSDTSSSTSVDDVQSPKVPFSVDWYTDEELVRRLQLCIRVSYDQNKVLEDCGCEICQFNHDGFSDYLLRS